MGNSDEPRARQGRPLEEHLGPDQDIQFVARCQSANRLGLGGRARDVPVQPADPGVGKQAPNLFLDPFGSEADRFNARTAAGGTRDRKSTRLNSSHSQISYAVFCLKKKTTNIALADLMARFAGQTYLC